MQNQGRQQEFTVPVTTSLSTGSPERRQRADKYYGVWPGRDGFCGTIVVGWGSAVMGYEFGQVGTADCSQVQRQVLQGL